MVIPKTPEQFFWKSSLSTKRRRAILDWINTLTPDQIQMIEELVLNESLEKDYAESPDQ